MGGTAAEPSFTAEGKVTTPAGDAVFTASGSLSGPKAPKGPGLTGVLGQASLVVGLVGSWMILAGWLYAYHYFYRFGLGVSALSVPFDVYPLYGFLVAKANWYWIALVLAAVLLLFFLIRKFGLAAPELLAGIVSAAVLLLFFGAAWLAEMKADADVRAMRENDYPGLRRVEVLLKEEVPEERAKSLAEGCQRLLFADDATLYLIRPLKGVSSLTPPVMAVPRDDILLFRLRSETGSCPPEVTP